MPALWNASLVALLFIDIIRHYNNLSRLRRGYIIVSAARLDVTARNTRVTQK